MWKDDLNEDIKESPAFKDIGDDINDLAQNYLDAQAHLGTSIRIPSEEASADDVTAFHTKLQERVPGLIATPDKDQPSSIEMFLQALGKPKEKDLYEIKPPDGITVTDQQLNLIKATAHEVGMTQDQLSGFLNKMYEQELEVASNHDVEIQGELLALKKDWGVTYDGRITSLTNNLLLSEAPTALTTAVKDGKIDSNTVKWLDQLFGKMSETTNLNGDDDNDDNEIVPIEAAARAKEIRTRLASGEIPAASTEYKNLLTKLLEYEKMAHPDSSSDINDLRSGVRTI